MPYIPTTTLKTSYEDVKKEVPDYSARNCAEEELNEIKKLAKKIPNFKEHKKNYRIQQIFEAEISSIGIGLHSLDGTESLPIDEIKDFYDKSKKIIKKLNDKLEDITKNIEENL